VNGHVVIVLGAFGCGAFGNDPELVSKVMSQVFRDEFPGVFALVIYCQGNGRTLKPVVWKAFETNLIKPTKSGSVGTSRKPCRFGCGRPHNRRINPRTGKPYDTCCWKCGRTKGKAHSAACDRYNGKQPSFKLTQPAVGKPSSQSGSGNAATIFLWIVVITVPVLILLGVVFFFLRKKKESHNETKNRVEMRPRRWRR